MKQLEVSIMGQTYILACPEGRETSLLLAVDSVDREMSTIRDAGRVKARERIAVLAALNLAYALSERPATSATPGDDGTPVDSAAQQAGAEWAAAAARLDLRSLVQRVEAALGDTPASS
ncbi:cell division protein ZapA [Sphaerotilus hippei]|uniref:Cell division protein ZapA n=1 Tax=Sphaerotilus hippei TaxID=744406 RepID=A0A318H6P6_9BURK|nr:cell division protein ZapA [Sphaerotilus hippei]PXW93284.1 cell division protein ZapA [Sphaerotilus hippei]